jgi:hypothetical protein
MDGFVKPTATLLTGFPSLFSSNYIPHSNPPLVLSDFLESFVLAFRFLSSITYFYDALYACRL